MDPEYLAAAPPFDLASSLRAMASFPPSAGEQVIAGGRVRKAFALADGRAVVAEVAEAPGGVELTVHGGDPAGEVRELVSRWLSLADDPSAFLATARTDPAMAPVLAETEGLHQVRFATLAEGACYFVLAQRTSQASAGTRKRRLAATYGPTAVLDGVEHRAFPRLERLAGLPVGELARFTANQRQAEYLAAVLERLAGWPPGWADHVSTDELLAELRTIRGVGEFTATGIAIRVLGRLDLMPDRLPAFTRALETLYGPGVSLEELTRRYGAQAGLWGYHVRTGIGWLGGPAR